MNTDNPKKSKAAPKGGRQTAAAAKGYRGHKAGSRKETIHQLYDREGADTAWTRGLKMKLKDGTLRSWFGQWQRSASKSKPAAKKPPASKATGDAKPANMVPTHEAVPTPEPAIVAG